MMRFFMMRHHSTAKKIIAHVEQKIVSELNSCEKIVSSARAYDSLSLYVEDKSKLASKLGDVLKDQIPDILYDKYQTLTEKNKKKIRDAIANAYFDSLTNFLGELNTIHIDFSYHLLNNGHIYASTTQLKAKVTLPNEFFEEDMLNAVLGNALSSLRQLLLESENNAYQYQNSML